MRLIFSALDLCCPINNMDIVVNNDLIAMARGRQEILLAVGEIQTHRINSQSGLFLLTSNIIFYH